jgi:hypothetical protein
VNYKSFIIFLFVSIFCIEHSYVVVVVPRAKAVAPALAPAAAIAILEALVYAVAAAYLIGVITRQQNEQYQSEINQMIADIERAVRNAAQQELNRIMSKATLLIGVINYAIRACGPSSSGGTDRRAQARAAQCTGSVESCCGDFLNKFQGRFERRSGGYRFLDSRRRVQCCAEWDSVHGGFEIFDSRGTHFGERGCEDLNDDPCRYTASRGSHALPNPSNHRPRTAACRP